MPSVRETAAKGINRHVVRECYCGVEVQESVPRPLYSITYFARGNPQVERIRKADEEGGIEDESF